MSQQQYDNDQSQNDYDCRSQVPMQLPTTTRKRHDRQYHYREQKQQHMLVEHHHQQQKETNGVRTRKGLSLLSSSSNRFSLSLMKIISILLLLFCCYSSTTTITTTTTTRQLVQPVSAVTIIDSSAVISTNKRKMTQQLQNNIVSLRAGSHTTTTTTTLKTKSLSPSKKRKRQQKIVSETTTTTCNNNIIHHDKAWVNGLKNALCSAGAAGCSKTILQPIDAIKTIQQYHQASGRGLTIFGAFQELIKRPGGFGNLYAGLSVSVLGSMPSVGLYFGVYSYCKQRLLTTSYGQNHPTTCIALSAAIGNTIASFSRVPYEVMKQQLQTGLYTSTFDAINAVMKGNNFWNMIFPKGGIAIQMIRDVPYAVVTLLCYESLQSNFQKYQQQQQVVVLVSEKMNNNQKSKSKNDSNKDTKSKKNKVMDFALGGIAGGIGSYVTNPMDVVKTRLQTNSVSYGGSVYQCTKAIYKEGGPAAFLRGSIPRLIHKVPANAFFFMFYELFRKILRVE